jgi:hypothetical protein
VGAGGQPGGADDRLPRVGATAHHVRSGHCLLEQPTGSDPDLAEVRTRGRPPGASRPWWAGRARSRLPGKTATSLAASATPRQWTSTAPSSPAWARTAIRGGTEARAQRRGYRRRRRAPPAARPGRAGRPGSPRSAPTPRPCRPARVETRSKRPALGGQAAGSARPRRRRPAPGVVALACRTAPRSPPDRGARATTDSRHRAQLCAVTPLCRPSASADERRSPAKALLSGGVQASGGSPAPDLIPIRMRPSQPGPKDERPAFPLVRGDARTRGRA